MIDYRIFVTEKPYSPNWNATELAVLARTFELKRLTVVSRGQHKNQIRIASPGESLASRPTDLESGVFEWAIAHEAYETYRNLRPIQDMRKGLFTALLNPTPLSYGSNPLYRLYSQIAEVLGWQLGFAITLWNDVGSIWPDLWDYYSPDTSEVDEPVYQPFLNFFRLIQSSRSSWDEGNSYTVTAQSVIEQMLGDFYDRKREPFTQDSTVIQVLLKAGISQEKIDSFLETMRVFFKTDHIPSLMAKYDRLLAELEEKAEKKSSTGSKTGAFANNPNWERELDAAVKLLGSDHITKVQIDALSKILTGCDVKLNFDKDVPGLGKFEIEVLETDKELKILSSITLRSPEKDTTAPYRLALCHEIGHFVHHSSWMIELGLAGLVIELIKEKDTQAQSELLKLRRTIQRELVQNHSALEIAADEFAVDVLIPGRARKALLDFCVSEKGFKVADFSIFAEGLLGLGSDFESFSLYSRRFMNIVEDKMPQPPLDSPPVIYGESLRKLRLLISKRRVEHLLDSFWANALAIITGSSPTQLIKSTSRTKTAVRPGFYFEGIVCD